MRAGMRALPGVRRIAEQIPAVATAWLARNEAALATGRPLWVALGDSTAQGIGTSSLDNSYIGLLHKYIGDDIAVINLSATGARISDVLDKQLPRIAALPRRTVLITCSVGSNDLLKAATPARFRREYEDLGERIVHFTPRAILAGLPTAAISVSGRLANRTVRDIAVRNGFAHADINRHFRGPYFRKLASDRFHPNDRGYREWGTAFIEAYESLGS